MRWLLVIVLIHGIAPSIAEAMEAAVHLAKTGHVVHSRACDDERGDQGPEHSCGATYHRCSCCTASPSTAAHEAGSVFSAAARSAPRDDAALALARRSLEPPFRPPIR